MEGGGAATFGGTTIRPMGKKSEYSHMGRTADPGAVVAQHYEFAATSTAQTGRLEVTSDPPGARVSVDGVPRGVTPFSMAAVPVGEHRVTLSSEQSSIQRQVTVADPRSIEVRSIPGKGTGFFIEVPRGRSGVTVPEVARPQPQNDAFLGRVLAIEDEASVRTHAQRGGFPANSIARVRSVIDPTTAEA